MLTNRFAILVRTLAAGFALTGAAILAPSMALAEGEDQDGGQSVTQTASGGEQTVREQSNDSTVTQAQGNGNLNLSPAVTVFGGEAETENYQGNGNDADATVIQGNAASQQQSAQQAQTVTQTAAPAQQPATQSTQPCCASGGEQEVEQKAAGGDQSIGDQTNDSEVNQYQGNGNVNVSPAVTVFGGEAETENYQGNGNDADATVVQGNAASQEQSATQSQDVSQDAGGSQGPAYDGGDSKCCEGGADQSASQSAYGGDQTIGEQKNYSDVTQKQGNGNINISPAIVVFGGEAETTNYQGNHNGADATVVQGNFAHQEQSADQDQTVYQGSGSSQNPCCAGAGGNQEVEQKASGGDQTIGEQKNYSDIDQWQGNGNINISPAIALFGGEGETKNSQGNYNDADAKVIQGNFANQEQTADQSQAVSQDSSGSACCTNGYTKDASCCGSGGADQSVTQSVYGGDQYIGEQKNYSDVTQKQGNGNVNVAPAIALGSFDHGGMNGISESSCNSGCGGHDEGGASTWNAQGNGNDADAFVVQFNKANQEQHATQHQSVTQDSAGSGCGCEPTTYAHSKDAHGDGGQSVSQSVRGGDQYIGEQTNSSDVTQKQGNWNFNISPAIALGSFDHGVMNGVSKSSCNSGCGGHDDGGASTWNAQGNGNDADAFVVQFNKANQEQHATQHQSVTQHSAGSGCGCEPTTYAHSKDAHGDGGQSVSQSVRGGDQYIGKQKNDSDVTQKQGNWNFNFAPAFSHGSELREASHSRCGCDGREEDGAASTWNSQGNHNDAWAFVFQGNFAHQAQNAWQRQMVLQSRGGTDH